MTLVRVQLTFVFDLLLQIGPSLFCFTILHGLMSLHACEKAKYIFFIISDMLHIVTRGQRQNDSQKAVIIDVMKSVSEIKSKIWTIV